MLRASFVNNAFEGYRVTLFSVFIHLLASFTENMCVAVHEEILSLYVWQRITHIVITSQIN